jgi:hypothetical protein
MVNTRFPASGARRKEDKGKTFGRRFATRKIPELTLRSEWVIG